MDCRYMISERELSPTGFVRSLTARAGDRLEGPFTWPLFNEAASTAADSADHACFTLFPSVRPSVVVRIQSVHLCGLDRLVMVDCAEVSGMAESFWSPTAKNECSNEIAVRTPEWVWRLWPNALSYCIVGVRIIPHLISAYSPGLHYAIQTETVLLCIDGLSITLYRRSVCITPYTLSESALHCTDCLSHYISQYMRLSDYILP